MKDTATIRRSDFAESLPESADELEVVVAAERKKLKRSLDELSTTVRDRLDVRSRLLEHPLMAVGAAMATGAVIGALSNRSTPRERASGEDRVSRTGSPSRRNSGEWFAQIALTLATLASHRLADVAKDGVRSALSTRRKAARSTDLLTLHKDGIS